ncbi:hypothetical protein B0H14DRAFT_3088544 [Mycena olivaceomarginata]|nr:hypothetical protein B0H14DRAFT_3088544 [Mycena olivaceomarginata]
MFDIATIPLSGVSAEEKILYSGKMEETGSYQGYKPQQYWHIDNGVHDQLEHYSINRDVTKRQHPEAVQPYLPEIEAFAQHNHFNVLHLILRHIGSITVLYSQPVAALQILAWDGKWRWIRHVENVINAGDALEFLLSGYYKATIHRVVQPPADKHTHTRLELFYFCMTDDAVQISPNPFAGEGAVFQRVRAVQRCADVEAPSMEQGRRARTSAYRQSGGEAL